MVRAGSPRYGSERPQNWPAVGRKNRNSPGDTVNGILQERLLNPKYFTHFERFLRLPQLNGTIDGVYTGEVVRACHRYLEIGGTGVADADVTFRPGGGINVETQADDDDQVIVMAHLDADSLLEGAGWDTSQRPLFYLNAVTGPIADDIADCILWAGYKLTEVEATADDADQFFFRYENGVNGGRWQAISSNNGTDTATDTGVTVAFNTNYRLLIEVDRDLVAHYYINDVEVATAATEAGTIVLRDLATFEFYMGIDSSGAANADKAWGLRNFIVSQLIT